LASLLEFLVLIGNSGRDAVFIVTTQGNPFSKVNKQKKVRDVKVFPVGSASPLFTNGKDVVLLSTGFLLDFIRRLLGGR